MDHAVNERSRFKKRIPLVIALVITFTLLFLLIWTLFIEPSLLVVTRYTVNLETLPDHWKGRTIAFFTDTHLGPTYKTDQLKRVVDTINKEQPDLVLFGGDLIDSRTPKNEAFASSVSETLALVNAPFGQYAVAGNHDNRLNAEYQYMAQMLKDGGFVLLDNASVMIDGIWLGGLAESYFGDPDIERTFSQDGLVSETGDILALPDDMMTCRLLLMHQPDYAAHLPDDSAQLIFSGHSHRGQITFFGRPIFTVFQGSQYPYGHYHLSENRQMIVSGGLGTVGIRARLGAPPELVLVTLDN